MVISTGPYCSYPTYYYTCENVSSRSGAGAQRKSQYPPFLAVRKILPLFPGPDVRIYTVGWCQLSKQLRRVEDRRLPPSSFVTWIGRVSFSWMWRNKAAPVSASPPRRMITGHASSKSQAPTRKIQIIRDIKITVPSLTVEAPPQESNHDHHTGNGKC